jgi:hypothetical protein
MGETKQYKALKSKLKSHQSQLVALALKSPDYLLEKARLRENNRRRP